MVIGDDVMLKQDVWININDVAKSEEAIIVLGSRCNLGRGSIISARNQLCIGRNTFCGPSVLVMDHNHAFEDLSRPILDQGTTVGGRILIKREFPRLCRGGSSSLTFPGVSPTLLQFAC